MQYADWAKIEQLWRAGVPSKTIAAQQGVTATTVAITARNRRWCRDADAMINMAQIKKQAFKKAMAETTGLDETAVQDLIDDAKDLEDHDMQAVVVHLHRKHVGRYRDLADTLFEELRATTEGREIYEQLAAMLELKGIDPKAAEKFDQLMTRVSTLSNRIASFKQLVEASKTLIAIERESFGLKPIDYDDSAKKAARAAAEVVTEGFDLIQNRFQAVLNATVVKEVTPNGDEIVVN